MNAAKRVLAGAWAALAAAALFGMWTAENAAAQAAHLSVRAFAATVIIPQRGGFVAEARHTAVKVTDVRADIAIEEQVATTVLDIGVENPTGSRQEAELVVPVPDGATVRGFTFQGAGAEPTAELLKKEDARRLYDSIVARTRDPALLEFVGYNLIRSSVFPVEPRGRQRVRVTYEQLLMADGSRSDYILPRSEALDYNVPWHIDVRIATKHRIAAVYSPSHDIATRQKSDTLATASITEQASRAPGPFRLSYLVEQDGVSASLFAYPGPKAGEGYFLLLAGAPPPRAQDLKSAIKREVTVVIDRSGSMAGEKLEQVRQAAIQIVEGLHEGESFNILAYNEAVESFSAQPVSRTRESSKAAQEYLARLNARGGTNLHDALLEALRQKPAAGALPIVLFLTDGLPTVGQVSEKAIRQVAAENNPHHRRVFTFGVGVDVNTPLLERIAGDTRARATFILPKEDVEVKVAAVFERLTGPVLADPVLTLLGADGRPANGRVFDLVPSRLPDLFNGDQFVLLGRYAGEAPLTFQIAGNYLGKTRTFRFTFEFDRATVRHAFVPRLWASRQIGVLTDAIRQAGADRPSPSSILSSGNDPQIKELVDEIIRLSTEFGILTEYTAFLAREGTDLSSREEVRREAVGKFQSRAMGVRSGWGSVNQEVNNGRQMAQTSLNGRNAFLDETMNRVEVTNVQQVSDMALYNRRGRWVDSRIVANESQTVPQRVIEFGSDEYRRVAERLAEQGRQGAMALSGDILLMVDQEAVLIRNR